jgi:predicted Abi (CAAX) family protease
MNALCKNLARSFAASPCSHWKTWGPWFCLYAVAALGIGFASGLFTLSFLDLRRFWFLPVTLLFFPCIPEEFFFRGLLIHREVLDRGGKRAAAQIGLSALLFTLWHPLNALTINKSAQPFFLNSWFLGITLLLGLTCGYAYVRSRSLWTPILIHWLTVLGWVICLGGRNLVLG